MGRLERQHRHHSGCFEEQPRLHSLAVLQHYYCCKEEQAQAIADGGDIPMYEPATLVERVQALKQPVLMANLHRLRVLRVRARAICFNACSCRQL